MLQTVVDPKIKGTAVAMFMFVTTAMSSVSSVAINPIIEGKELDPSRPEHRREYGHLLAYFTMIPCAVAIPCFYMAGRRYRAVKEAQAAAGEAEEAEQEEI